MDSRGVKLKASLQNKGKQTLEARGSSRPDRAEAILLTIITFLLKMCWPSFALLLLPSGMSRQDPSHSEITRGERSQRGSSTSTEAATGLSEPSPAPHAYQRRGGHTRRSARVSQRGSSRWHGGLPVPAPRELVRARPGLRGEERPLRRGSLGAGGRHAAAVGADERPRPRRGEAAVKGKLPGPGKRHPRRPPVCLLCFGTVPPARPSVRGGRLTAPHLRAHGGAGGGQTPASTLRVRVRTRLGVCEGGRGDSLLSSPPAEKRLFFPKKRRGGSKGKATRNYRQAQGIARRR